ncbi:hypothetical protein F4823DRAFT_72745 [Ustulina deusta]|nr:hypothetical protein F4823DRAFT_72745 [Ustulina deusta]
MTAGQWQLIHGASPQGISKDIQVFFRACLGLLLLATASSAGCIMTTCIPATPDFVDTNSQKPTRLVYPTLKGLASGGMPIQGVRIRYSSTGLPLGRELF